MLYFMYFDWNYTQLSSMKNSIISTSYDCCVAIDAPLHPPLAAFVLIDLPLFVWLVFVSIFHLWPLAATTIVTIVIYDIFCFYQFLSPILADCCFYCSASHPAYPRPSVVCVVFVALVLLAFRREVMNQPVTSSVHLWLASAVIVTEIAAELPTPPPVAEAFVMVLVAFGGGWQNRLTWFI